MKLDYLRHEREPEDRVIIKVKQRGWKRTQKIRIHRIDKTVGYVPNILGYINREK